MTKCAKAKLFNENNSSERRLGLFTMVMDQQHS